ncbi:MAG: type II toxin-antitoxin system prevent-host-death family antitoxin [Saprospiraceae bacterium]|nr:type II toxin-antitoxin system prevent-host-death family antitoxin [Saprospiraceae bacterium]
MNFEIRKNVILAKLANKNIFEMEIVNMHNAKSRLSELVKKVLSGEKIIISKNNEPLIELVVFKKEGIKRKPGALKGKIWSSEDCWDTDNEIIDAVDSSEIFPV